MATITAGAVILLILIGSLVRMTGSGMGCPDWPKCFGQWIPPTDISQLPADYQTRFAVAGREIAPFEATKTWIEYLNRLFGVLVGLFGLGTFAVSLQQRRSDPAVVWWSLGGLFLIVVAAGLGAYVVKTNLSEGMITIHMVVALGVLTCYLWAISRQAEVPTMSMPSMARWVGLMVLVLLLSQVVLGTQVREQVDALHKAGVDRAAWIGMLEGAYGIHKFSHYALGAALVWWSFLVWKRANGSVRRVVLLSLLFAGAEVLMGLGMHHLEVPRLLQPLHLLFATLLFASHFLALRWVWMSKVGLVAER